MKVIPKQKEYVVVKLDYSDEMFITIGKYLTENKDFKLVKDPLCTRKQLCIYAGNGFVDIKKDDYLLIDTTDVKHSIYAEKDNFKEDYIEIKEGEE